MEGVWATASGYPAVSRSRCRARAPRGQAHQLESVGWRAALRV
jgi:hypothetical protein